MVDFKIPSFCKNDPRHIATRLFLKANIPEDEYNKRMEKYIEDCKICSNDANCLAQARTNLSRDDSIYPWSNYDWDYSNYVDNNYSAMATGSGPKENIFKNLNTSIKIAKGFLIDPNPGDNSKPNLWNKDGDFPMYGCLGPRTEGCKKWWTVRNRADLGKPYKDPFFEENKKVGVNSSSYYVKVGTCNRRDITNENDCNKRGYNWIDGNCFQDRYGYIDNTVNLDPFRGLVPSIATDLLAFNPLYIKDAYDGKSSSYMKIQDCPKIEGFANSTQNSVYICIIVGLVILYVSKKLLK